MDAFEKWADDCDETDEKYYAIPVGSVGRAVAREAFRAGMRAAAAMCNAADKSTHPADLADAILKEIGE